MASIKTAISIDEGLFKQADAVAHEMGVSRSRVFSLALEEYLQRRENRELLDRIDAALASDAQEEERAMSQRMRRLHQGAIDPG